MKVQFKRIDERGGIQSLFISDALIFYKILAGYDRINTIGGDSVSLNTTIECRSPHKLFLSIDCF